MVEILAGAAIAVFIYMTAVFGAAHLFRDNSIVDIAWGPGLILVGWLSLLLGGASGPRQIMVTAFVTVWGLRLAVHISRRNRGRGEDFRYAKWRRDWGRWFVLRSYLQIFMLQGIFLLIISWSVLLVNASAPRALGALDFAGAAVWAAGFFFEAVGDAQLARFKTKPENKGRIMTAGLWRFTRHPNYFGEAVMWWGIFLVALSAPLGWTGIVSPLVITFLLLRVSGVTMLEKKYAGNREFAEYARGTSAFFPLPPKREKTS
ncbi:MAG: steroid 5-alpha reductase [Candidatus Aminicenantes bacterium RBG_16_63_16]|nr:MAG: steroid 5-alpha reductase [Candidatus Aminicenantes bacterium RBG_16_63_16]